MNNSRYPYIDYGAHDFTSASAHPELLVGEFAMRPRIHVRLAADDQHSVTRWSRRLGAMVMMAFLVTGISSLLAWPAEHAIIAKASTRPANPACLAWDSKTSEAVASFMQETKHNIDLTRMTNVVSQMRKARHSCRARILEFSV